MEERRAAELRQGVDDAAAGAKEPRAFVRNHDLGRLAIGEMRFDLVGEVMHIDDGGGDAGMRQLVEHVVDQRLAGDRDQRLRHVVRQRTHARAEAGGHHHGVTRSVRGIVRMGHCVAMTVIGDM